MEKHLANPKTAGVCVPGGGGGSGIRKINKKSKAVVLNKPWFGSRGSELLVVRDSEGVYLLDDVDVSRPAKLGPEIGSCN